MVTVLNSRRVIWQGGAPASVKQVANVLFSCFNRLTLDTILPITPLVSNESR